MGRTFADVLSMTERVRQVVVARESISISQVLAAVSGFFSAATAAACARRLQRKNQTRKERAWQSGKHKPTPSHHARRRADLSHAEMVEAGKRHLICWYLYHLTKHGKIRRIETGVYGPPLPKLYKPEGKKKTRGRPKKAV